ncbi:hypothetical protein CD30_15200 [Ureibacillus massiliensis 4400831 = CIP 108448 = CCUG 49529]|uniref:Uncharacterized protein n=1 Tax=Ureibacillus massiliensis 4400831 = CIP 108448 = CCUG 49529 TaxID=1211035 RepID=A0A0A3J3P8_9BACL|nr:hypothetical protein [Ureibacillus massiliensis]KGR89773.1 hypothetical protein CD30_15200 [Ureibacillus massiliensis 4400831 = CIP 108448 = CCUG 49529]BDH63579.1 hypothetical protein MTP04_37090 [Lysinibacillus sp. PLM2]
MTVNHSSTLTIEYFQSYIQLVMNSRELSLEEATQFIDQFFFSGDLLVYGTETKNNFELAINSFK